MIPYLFPTIFLSDYNGEHMYYDNHHLIFYHRNYPTDNSPDEDEWPDEIESPNEDDRRWRAAYRCAGGCELFFNLQNLMLSPPKVIPLCLKTIKAKFEVN